MTQPLLLVCMGVSGCGKTTVGQLVAAERGWAFLDADDYWTESEHAAAACEAGLAEMRQVFSADGEVAAAHLRLRLGGYVAVAVRDLEAGDLRNGHEEREAVHKPNHHRRWEETNERAEPEHSEEHLEDAVRHHGVEHRALAVRAHQSREKHGDRGSGAADHAWTSAEQRRDDTHRKCGLQADLRVHPRHERKGNGFGHLGERDGGAAENLHVARRSA